MKNTLKSATTMNVRRSQLLKLLPNAIETFGYITKENRYHHGIEKLHSNDAFVIAGGSNQYRASERTITFKRKNNRSLQKNRNGFSPSIRKQHSQIQPEDLITWNGQIYVAQGMQNKGAYLKFTNGMKSFVKNMKQIGIVFHQKGLIYS